MRAAFVLAVVLASPVCARGVPRDQPQDRAIAAITGHGREAMQNRSSAHSGRYYPVSERLQDQIAEAIRPPFPAGFHKTVIRSVGRSASPEPQARAIASITGAPHF